MNLLDRAISLFSPQAALSRVRARAQISFLEGSGYVGGSHDRRSLMAWSPFGGDPDADSIHDLPTLRARSRDLYRNTPIAKGAISTATTNVVGSGLKLNSRIDREFLGMYDDQADKWERDVEREFYLWADSQDCDASRTDDFHTLQNLVFLSALKSGDVFVLLPQLKRPGRPYDLRLQVIEADRIKTPDHMMEDDKLAGGVEVDRFGAPMAYYISNKHPGSFYGLDDGYKRIPAFGSRTGRRNVIHLFDRIRPGQRRGVPYLAPVIESLKQLGRYTEAELMAAVVAGMFTVFVKSDNGDVNPFEGVLRDGFDPASYFNKSKSALPTYQMGNGTIVTMNPGEEIEIADPKRPNQAFDVFVQAIITQIGAGLDMPFEVITKHFQASYSASRASLLEAWKFFKTRRTWLVSKFCQPVYEEFLTEAVSNGRVSAPGFLRDPAVRKAFSKAEWIGPSQGQIDPKKEVEAAVIRVENDFSTRAEEAQALTGGDWETKHRQRAKEERMRKEAGLTATSTFEESPKPEEPDDADEADKNED